MSERAEKSPKHYAIGKKNPNLPFHPAVRAGDFIFVSGQVPKDENNNMISGTIEEETLATLKTIERIIAAEGATLGTQSTAIVTIRDRNPPQVPEVMRSTERLAPAGAGASARARRWPSRGCSSGSARRTRRRRGRRRCARDR